MGTFSSGTPRITMGNITYFIALSLMYALGDGSPINGSHRSAPINPRLYYRAEDSPDSAPLLVESPDGSHRSAPSDPATLYIQGDQPREPLAIEPVLSIPNGSHRSAPQATPYNREDRYTLRNNENTGIGTTDDAWHQVWER